MTLASGCKRGSTRSVYPPGPVSRAQASSASSVPLGLSRASASLVPHLSADSFYSFMTDVDFIKSSFAARSDVGFLGPSEYGDGADLVLTSSNATDSGGFLTFSGEL